MLAAYKGHSDIIKLLLEAGASIEAKDNVSERISICTCVRVSVCVLYSCIMVLFYSILNAHPAKPCELKPQAKPAGVPAKPASTPAQPQPHVIASRPAAKRRSEH